MIVKLSNKQQIPFLVNKLKQTKFDYIYLSDKQEFVIPKLNDKSFLNEFSNSISEIIEIETHFQLSSNKYKKQTCININGSEISNEGFSVIAGPCSIETEEQIFSTAEYVSSKGLKFLRGGAYKPRTSPYSFRGLGLDGLKLIKEAATLHGLNVVTELMDLSLLDEVLEYSDIIQIGSRNMSNFFMLSELGKIKKPILLKRGMQAKTNEWLLAADYILSNGNEEVILCERGIRSFDPQTRNVFDVNVIPLIQSLSHLPIIADPSHGTGEAKFVYPISLAAVAAGANGLMIEIHPQPKTALSDSNQALTFSEFDTLLSSIQIVRESIVNLAIK
ncbi:MAG: 3-deoxy-7-phosphoheptulonate synthase [Bacteroidetes bacterium]|nr:3-deoxy-7-phosphoheptulonate synthase [Bacteroidota bacterium]